MTATPTRKLAKRRDGGSKMVRDQVKAASALRASINTFKQEVAAGLGQLLAPELHHGETLPDHALSLELVGRAVKSTLDRLLDADRQYDRCYHALNTLSRRCKRVADELRPRAQQARRSIDGIYGKEGGEKIHAIFGRISQNPPGLYDQLWPMLARLRDRARTLPKPLAAGSRPIVRRDLLADLEPGHKELRQILRDLEELRAAKIQLCAQRKAALKQFKADLGRARRLLDAAYALAGCNLRARKDLLSYREVRQRSKQARRRREERRERRDYGERAAPAAVASGAAAVQTGTRGFKAALAGLVRRWLPDRWQRVAEPAPETREPRQ